MAVAGAAMAGGGASSLACSRGAPASKPSADVVAVGPSAPSVRPVPIADVVPEVSAPALKPGVEKRAKVIWDAQLLGSDATAAARSKHCTLETTIASTDGGDLHLVSDFSVRCGGVTLYEPDGLRPGAAHTVREVPGVEQGTYRYTIVYSRAGALIDTPHGRALIDTSGAGTRLVVSNESRTVKQRLLTDTPEFHSFRAGFMASAADDSERSGRVVSAAGDTVVAPGAFCWLGFHYYGTIDGVDRCDVLALCDRTTLLGRPERFSTHCKRQGTRVISAQDLKPQPLDSDPAIDLDERSARIWNDIDGARWSVNIALDVPR